MGDDGWAREIMVADRGRRHEETRAALLILL
jgi:hypothetical protein